MAADGENKIYSIVLRVRRVTTEHAYVSVPVTDAIMSPADESGKTSIDSERFVAEGIRYAADPDVAWVAESLDVHPHPTQTPVPDGYPVKNQWASLRQSVGETGGQ